MAQSRRPIIPRPIKLIPAAILSVIMLALLSLLGLLNFDLPSFDDGSASNEEVSEAEVAETDPQPQLAFTSELDPQPITSDPESTEPTPQLEPMGLVDVLIDGESYLAATDRFDAEIVRQQMTLDEVVAAASQAKGDRAGIKAPVSRTFNATARAEKELVDALMTAGLQQDEIDQRRTLVAP